MNRKTWSMIATSFLSASVLAASPAQAALMSCHAVFLDPGPISAQDAAVLATSEIARVLAKSNPYPQAQRYLQQIAAELYLRKERVTEQNIQIVARAVEDRRTSYPSKISPKLFAYDFQPHKPTSWNRLRESDLVIRHFDEVLDIFSALEPADVRIGSIDGADMLPIVRDKLQTVLDEKLMELPTARVWIGIENAIVKKIQSLKTNPKALDQLMVHLSTMNTVSERVFIAAIEARKEIEKTDDDFFAAGLAALEYTMAIKFPVKTAALQMYLIRNKSHFRSLALMLLPTMLPLTQESNQALKIIMQDNIRVSDGIKIAGYFLKNGLYEAEALKHLTDLQARSAQLHPEQVEAVRDLLSRKY